MRPPRVSPGPSLYRGADEAGGISTKIREDESSSCAGISTARSIKTRLLAEIDIFDQELEVAGSHNLQSE